jgi:hypothetical protein
MPEARWLTTQISIFGRPISGVTMIGSVEASCPGLWTATFPLPLYRDFPLGADSEPSCLFLFLLGPQSLVTQLAIITAV